jgi:Ran GTPase-activating protein (RanGAP) involved in mRNA processing and transport
MPGDLPTDENSVHCPVHRVAVTPCGAQELAPLLAHLSANLAVQGVQRFPRGTMLDDGRLDLCKQSLGTENCLRLVAALQDNTRVRSLMLGTDAIGDVGAGAVARLVAGNAHLQVLYLGCNNIGPEGARELAAMVAQAPQITGLWLKRNPLGPEGAESIARMLRDNKHLRMLDLVNTDLRGAGVRAVADALCAGNSSLRSLYLSGNGLGPSVVPDLARLLREAPQIAALYVSANHLGDAGAIELAKALRHNSTLQTLELASNGIGSEGARALFEAVGDSGLRNLNLGYAVSGKALGARANEMGDEGAACAAKLITTSPALRALDLTRNGITMHGRSVLIEATLHNRRLGRLIVEGSQPKALVQHLAQNRAAHGDDAPKDQALIKSVYR